MTLLLMMLSRLIETIVGYVFVIAFLGLGCKARLESLREHVGNDRLNLNLEF